MSSVTPHCASLMLPSGDDGKIAAVFTTMSRPPKAASDSRKAARIESRSRMSIVDSYRRFLAADLSDFFSNQFRGFEILVRHDHMRAAPAASSAVSRPMPFPPPTTRTNLTAQLFLRRLPANFRFFQLPILNPKRFRRRQRYIVRVHGERFGLRCGTCLRQDRRRRFPNPGGIAPSITWMALV